MTDRGRGFEWGADTSCGRLIDETSHKSSAPYKERECVMLIADSDGLVWFNEIPEWNVIWDPNGIWY